MMCADFIRLKEELDLFKEKKVDFLHLDIMDGHYVPNLSLGIDFARALYNYCGIRLDFHLMVENPEHFISLFSEIKGSVITIHPETTWHPDCLLRSIREMDCFPGIAIDPALPFEQFRHLYPLADLVLMMTVNPGYAGQRLVPYTIKKITELREWGVANGYNFDIEVDGNVSWDNIPKMINAGATILVAGSSSLFQPGLPRKDALDRLDNLVNTIKV